MGLEWNLDEGALVYLKKLSFHVDNRLFDVGRIEFSDSSASALITFSHRLMPPSLYSLTNIPVD